MSETSGTPKKRREWKPAWLSAFEEFGTVTEACRAVGVGRATVYRARQADEDFALAWSDLEELTTERMEREAYRRGVEGVEKHIYHQGEVVGAERQFSDTLLIFMLKSRRPERYRDNVKLEHTGAHGGAIKVDQGLDVSRLTDDELDRLRDLLDRATAQSA